MRSVKKIAGLIIFYHKIKLWKQLKNSIANSIKNLDGSQEKLGNY